MRLFLAIFMPCLFLAGCGESAEDNNVSIPPSPLIDADKDRLWIVMNAGPGIRLFCENYYASPEDPRYAGNEAKCTVWELDSVDHLKINGFADIRVEHMRDPALFTWWREYQNGIHQCMNGKVGKAQRYCDPYQKALGENGPQGIGVNYPEGKAPVEYNFGKPKK